MSVASLVHVGKMLAQLIRINTQATGAPFLLEITTCLLAVPRCCRSFSLLLSLRQGGKGPRWVDVVSSAN
jgi:hypothetical protein